MMAMPKPEPPPSAAIASSVAASAVTLEGSELVLTPAERVQESEIVAIVPESKQQGAGYRVCWLREKHDAADGANGADGANDTNRANRTTNGTKEQPPFALSTARLDAAAVESLPVEFLERHQPVGVPGIFGGGASALHVVVSTQSGLQQAQTFYDHVLAPLLAVFGVTAAPANTATNGDTPANTANTTKRSCYHLLVTTSSRSIPEFAQRLASDATAGAAAPTVILLSGDGGVVDLLNGLTARGSHLPPRSHRPAIAVLPLGTGNALFHSLHRPDYAAGAAPSPFVLGLRTICKGSAVPLPNFEATFSPGSHTVRYSLAEEQGAGGALEEEVEPVGRLLGAIVASYGFHAQLVWESDTPEYRKHGDKRFAMAAQALLETSHAYAADVRVTETASGQEPTPRTLGHRFNYVLAAMVSNLERTFTISPASRPLDGQLRLVHFGAVDGAKTMEIMMAAYNNGAHVGMQWPGKAGANGAESLERVGYEAIDKLEVNVQEKDARWRKVYVRVRPVPFLTISFR